MRHDPAVLLASNIIPAEGLHRERQLLKYFDDFFPFVAQLICCSKLLDINAKTLIDQFLEDPCLCLRQGSALTKKTHQACQVERRSQEIMKLIVGNPLQESTHSITKDFSQIPVDHIVVEIEQRVRGEVLQSS